MAHSHTSHREQVIGRFKSAIATAAVVGTVGGWIAFGTHSSPATVAATAGGAAGPAVAQSNSAAPAGNAVGSADQAGAPAQAIPSRRSRQRATTSTRSSH